MWDKLNFLGPYKTELYLFVHDDFYELPIQAILFPTNPFGFQSCVHESFCCCGRFGICPLRHAGVEVMVTMVMVVKFQELTV